MILEVSYETSPSATALQWLTPEQTAGKRQPYLFSQCQVGVVVPPAETPPDAGAPPPQAGSPPASSSGACFVTTVTSKFLH